MSRGNGRMQIFLDEIDYRKFFYLLSDVVDTYDVECLDFSAMPNHYHLALRNREPNLSRAMQHLNGEYAKWWNAAHVKVGHVLQGRFKAQIVQEDGYFLSLVRYIALNPVRAKLVDHPSAWPWSSYHCNVGLVPSPAFLSSGEVLRQFGDGDIRTLRERYVRHVLSLSEEEDVRAELFRSRERILGDRNFKRAVLGLPPSPNERDASAATAHSASSNVAMNASRAGV